MNGELQGNVQLRLMSPRDSRFAVAAGAAARENHGSSRRTGFDPKEPDLKFARKGQGKGTCSRLSERHES